ncbi:hypothetical protein C8J55DRAFT_545860 [Lentinula edodes]|uniref:Uncharacterized protein n=1 Tax=Lentinula lateritia TaxID=40482 RepID=A0A9W9B0L4_9AGAR|nr:hypothetical protein C8J55DRAFT_545860 [Lentinula edodes]
MDHTLLGTLFVFGGNEDRLVVFICVTVEHEGVDTQAREYGRWWTFGQCSLHLQNLDVRESKGTSWRALPAGQCCQLLSSS